MAVSKRLRFEVLRRDNHTCRYCGAAAPDVKITVDHVTPVALGGSDEASNLVASCADCNSGKASVSPDADLVADVDQDALRWARAMAKACEIVGAQFDQATAYVEAVDAEWSSWRTAGGDGDDVPRPPDWATSVRRWFEYGLPEYVAVGLIEQAMTAPTVRNEWRYYCGCCWRKVDDIIEAARGLVEEAGD